MHTTAMALGFADAGTKLVEFAVELLNFAVTSGENLLNAAAAQFSTTSNTEFNVFTTIGTTLMAFLFTIEMCSTAMGFHFEDIHEAARFLFKAIIYKIIVENSSNIVGGTIGLFSDTFTSLGKQFESVSTNLKNLGANLKKATVAPAAPNGNKFWTAIDDGLLGINKAFVALGIIILTVIVFILIVKIAISVAGLIFEIGIHIAVAPLATATLVYHETRSLGINYIKSLVGVCATIGVYGICFNIYSTLYSSIESAIIPTNEINAFAGGSLLIAPIVSLFLLSVAVKNAGNVVQRALG